MTTATQTLRIHIVWPKDDYDSRNCAAYPRCRRPLRDLDVVIIDPSNSAAARHIQCIPARQAAELPPPASDTERCWYTADMAGAGACPLLVAAHQLCADHHAQLCGDGKKPRTRR